MEGEYTVKGFAIIGPDGYIVTPSEIARLLNSYAVSKEAMRNNNQAMREALEIEHQRALKAEEEIKIRDHWLNEASKALEKYHAKFGPLSEL